jgi:trimeric autotransporter adhesin
MNILHARRLVLVAICAAMAASCGGGGGDGPDPDPDPVPVDPPGAAVLEFGAGLKELLFSWESVPGADEYRLLANPDGSSGFVQVGNDIPGSETSVAIDVPVHLFDWPNARFMLDACNDGGCTGSNEVGTDLDDAIQAIGYFKNSNHEAGDFVLSVALSADGRTLAVGAPNEDSAATGIDGDQASDGAEDSGAVYVFQRVGRGWLQQAYVKPSQTQAGDFFGIHVDLSADGNILAVGASASLVDPDQVADPALAAGAAYVFVRDGAGAWSQQAHLKASNPDPGDRFGTKLALSADGDTLAVGATFEDSSATGIDGDESDNTAAESGAAYVFRRDASGDWNQQAYVKAPNTGAGDIFGTLVDLDGDGDTLAVVASSEDSAAVGVGGDMNDENAMDAGAAYVYVSEDGGDTWSFQSYVKAPNTDAGDTVARVALSDDGLTLAIGALAEDGSSSGVNGDFAAKGTGASGAVFIYGRDGSEWSFETYLKASNPGVVDFFGSALAVSADGNTIAVGARGEDGGSSGVGGDESDDSGFESGAAYVFRRDDGDAPWSQRAYLKAPNSDADDDFGGSFLALSADGSTLAIVASHEAGGATGIGGDQSDNSAPAAGAVYLY